MPGISALHAAMPETADGVICLPPGLLNGVRYYRLERIRRELRKRRVPAIVLYDPVNIRYATDTRTSGSAANGSKPAAGLGKPHESVDAGMQPEGDAQGRADCVRYRPRRSFWLLRRYLAHVGCAPLSTFRFEMDWL